VKKLMTIPLLVLSVNGSVCFAQNPTPESQVTQVNREDMKAAIQKLIAAGALKVDENGNAQIEPSLVDEMRAQGLIGRADMSKASICADGEK